MASGRPDTARPASRVRAAGGPNRLAPLGFVIGFGVVSMLADFVYQGGRAIIGPYLATLGAGATLVGVVTGAGEAVALVFRLGFGWLSDRTGRRWPLSILGYAMTVVCVPLLAVTHILGTAVVLVVGERFGKAVRAPARDTMLAQAATDMGVGWAFAVHEGLDQVGAVGGPLLVALMVSISGYRLGFAVLAIPGVLALAAVAGLRRAAPAPDRYAPEPAKAPPGKSGGLAGLPARFWLYAAFTALTMLGYATFGVLSYHLQARHVVPEATIPIIYAVAMAVQALAGLASGPLYDRIGLRGLIVMPVLAGVVPFLSFQTTTAPVWVGAAVWGAVMGMHGSTARAAVSDLVPAVRRGVGYGAFATVQGLGWLAGSAAIGALYSSSIGSAQLFVVITQVVALAAFVPLISRARR